MSFSQEQLFPSDVPSSPDAASRLLMGVPVKGVTRVGGFEIYPAASMQAYYDNNINAQPVKVESWVFTIAPGLSALTADNQPGAAKLLNLSYTPILRFYTADGQDNAFDQAGSLSGTMQFNKLTLGVTEAVVVTDSTQPDVGAIANTFSSNTGLSADYQLGYRTSLSVDGGLSISNTEGYSGNRTWTANGWYNYQANTRLSLGAGVGFGFVNIFDTADTSTPTEDLNQTYEQLNVRAGYSITEKINVSASLGVQFQQYDSGAPDTTNPIWNLAGTYQPWRSTTFSLALFQTFNNSAYYGNQDYLSTGVSFAVAHRFLQRFMINAGIQYSHNGYQSAATGVVADRTDDVFGMAVSVSMFVKKNWSVGAFYNYDQDESTLPTFTYNRQRVGLQSTWSY